MSVVLVHERIAENHPEVKENYVLAAMRRMIQHRRRSSGEWIAVGLDGRGRLVELVYQYDELKDRFFVFHGMTPPTRKMLKELGLER